MWLCNNGKWMECAKKIGIVTKVSTWYVRRLLCINVFLCYICILSIWMNMDRERREKVDDYIASLSNELEESIKNVTDPTERAKMLYSKRSRINKIMNERDALVCIICLLYTSPSPRD